MRKILPLLLLLCACEANLPVTPAIAPVRDDSSFQQLQRMSSDPEGVAQYAESESSQGKLELWEWDRLIGGAAESGNQMLFARIAAVAPKVKDADLKNQRSEVLRRAAGFGQIQLIDWLLTDPQWKTVGFNLNEDTGNYQGTALTQAIKTRKLETIDGLLAKGADPKLVLKNGESALTAAVETSDRSLVDKFLALGLSLNSDQGMPPLFVAVRNNDQAMVQYLLDKGANLHATYREVYYEGIPGSRPESVLAMAIMYYSSDNEMLKFLLAKGATPDRPEHASVVASLIKNRYYEWSGSNVDPSVQETLSLLLKYKPDLKAADSAGKSALAYVVERGYINALEQFVSAGADLKMSEDDGKTLLMYAAESGSLAMVQFLLYRGADVKAKDLRGRRALDYAYGDVLNYLASIPTR